jgi:hypothetical protein
LTATQVDRVAAEVEDAGDVEPEVSANSDDSPAA